MSMIVDVADAVVTQINAGTYTPTFTAQRLFLPKLKLPDLKTLLVTVIPTSREINRVTRSDNDNRVEITVGVQKAVSNITTDVEDLLDLVDEIITQVDKVNLPSGKLMTQTSLETAYDDEALHYDQVFVGMISLTYRIFEQETS